MYIYQLRVFCKQEPKDNAEFIKKFKNATNEQKGRIRGHAVRLYESTLSLLKQQMTKDQALHRSGKFVQDNDHSPQAAISLDVTSYFGIFNAVIKHLFAKEFKRRSAYHGNWDSEALELNKKKIERIVTLKLWRYLLSQKANFFSNAVDV